MLRKLSCFLFVVSLAGCGVDESRSGNQAPGNGGGAAAVPKKTLFEAVFGSRVSYNLQNLPQSGTVDSAKVPYSGFWYPDSLGGTGIRFSSSGLSALEKYDRVFNTSGRSAQAWESSNHANIPEQWSGHCNGWSAAAQRHAEPRHAVTRNGITFEPRDIKALLAEIYMSAKPVFLGGNRCDKRSTAPTSILATILGNNSSDAQCEPVSPALFHIALANWIGVKRHTIIFDKSSSNEVWNFPIYAYSVQTSSIDRNQATQYARGKPLSAQAVSFSLVQLQITHADALGKNERTESNTAPTQRPVQQGYSYMLELDQSGNIIDGQWTNQNEIAPPDFAWVAFEPFQNDSDARFGNPNLDVQKVMGLWAESVDLNSASPPQDILAPCWPLDQCINFVL